MGGRICEEADRGMQVAKTRKGKLEISRTRNWMKSAINSTKVR